jgi:hypothetical protein
MKNREEIIVSLLKTERDMVLLELSEGVDAARAREQAAYLLALDETIIEFQQSMFNGGYR